MSTRLEITNFSILFILCRSNSPSPSQCFVTARSNLTNYYSVFQTPNEMEVSNLIAGLLFCYSNFANWTSETPIIAFVQLIIAFDPLQFFRFSVMFLMKLVHLSVGLQEFCKTLAKLLYDYASSIHLVRALLRMIPILARLLTDNNRKNPHSHPLLFPEQHSYKALSKTYKMASEHKLIIPIRGLNSKNRVREHSNYLYQFHTYKAT